MTECFEESLNKEEDFRNESLISRIMSDHSEIFPKHIVSHDVIVHSWMVDANVVHDFNRVEIDVHAFFEEEFHEKINVFVRNENS